MGYDLHAQPRSRNRQYPFWWLAAAWLVVAGLIWPGESGLAVDGRHLQAFLLPPVSREDHLSSALLPITGRFSNLQVLTPSLARFDKFELQFELATQAANPSLPYDPRPPAGLSSGAGITVNALFSPDNWQTVYTQPAFLYQPYKHSLRDSRDHFSPNGALHWRVRFTPQQTGSWQYRLYVEDQDGREYFPPLGKPGLNFTVAGESRSSYRRSGFLRVSPNDPRYFEFQDGTTFNGQGFNDSFDNTSEVAQKLARYEQNKMNFMRVWMSGDGINGSQWSSWASHHLPGDGYLPGVSLDIQNTYPGADVSLRLDDDNPCLFADFWQGGVPVEPNTSYTVSARLKVANLTGPAGSGEYGFVMKTGDWLEQGCREAGNGTPISTPIHGTTGWTTVSGSLTTSGSQYWLDNLYLSRQNATGGEVYIDEVRVWRTGDPAKVNILREPNANSHLYFDPLSSAEWDLYIEAAERHGVYLKLVIDEKNEWIRNHIGYDGRMTPDGSNDLFYARPGTKGRWLQEAWWRYLIARWGYSTAVHSFEYVNEGDPYNGYHHEAANAMARYFDQNDPARHLVTTSFWSAFPNAEMWSNSSSSELDYADIHAYISTGWGQTASFLSSSRIEKNRLNVYSGSASARIDGTDNFSESIGPRGMVIRGRGEWIIRYRMKASGFTANCEHGSLGGQQRVTWKLDGGVYWGGQEGVVPFNREGKDFLCTSPDGTYNWTLFSSDRDRDGNPLPVERRIVIRDDQPHEISMSVENKNGTGGVAWIDEVELVSPGGQVQSVIGEFEIHELDEDTAWYNRAYGEVWGAASLVGAKMPLVRGETGLDFTDNQDWNRDLLKDRRGIWLHNNVWGQVNPGGMYELFWWVEETIPSSLFDNFLTYRNFMEGIPLSNGHYRDVSAIPSSPDLRAWGQRDDSNGRMHLWVQNKQHTWKKVVNGSPISPVSGTVTLSNVANGAYRVEWWDTYKTRSPIFKTETLWVSNGMLTLTLPDALTTDVGVKVFKQ